MMGVGKAAGDAVVWRRSRMLYVAVDVPEQDSRGNSSRLKKHVFEVDDREGEGDGAVTGSAG